MIDGMLVLAQNDAAGALCGLFCSLMFLGIWLAAVAFQIWMIVDVAIYESKMPDNQLVMWLLLMIFLGPIPALIYYFVRRPHNRHAASMHGKGYQQPPQDPYWRPPY